MSNNTWSISHIWLFKSLFRTFWNILDGVSCENNWLFLAGNYFYNKFHLRYFNRFWMRPKRPQSKNYYGGISFLNISKGGDLLQILKFLWHCRFDEHQGRLHRCKQFIIHFLVNTSTLVVPRNTAVINRFEIVFRFGNNTHISGTLNNENIVFVFVFWVFSYFADVWSEGDSNCIFHSSNEIINNLKMARTKGLHFFMQQSPEKLGHLNSVEIKIMVIFQVQA